MQSIPNKASELYRLTKKYQTCQEANRETVFLKIIEELGTMLTVYRRLYGVDAILWTKINDAAIKYNTDYNQADHPARNILAYYKRAILYATLTNQYEESKYNRDQAPTQPSVYIEDFERAEDFVTLEEVFKSIYESAR